MNTDKKSHPLSVRASNVLHTLGIPQEKAAVRRAIVSGKLFVGTRGPSNYGATTHAELCRWVGIVPPHVPQAAFCGGGGIGHQILQMLRGPDKCRKFSVHFEVGRAVYVIAEYYAPADGLELMKRRLGYYELLPKRRPKEMTQRGSAEMAPAAAQPMPAPRLARKVNPSGRPFGREGEQPRHANA